jgi:hypothetical protein
LDDARRDLELKKFTWGPIEGGDRSKLSLGQYKVVLRGQHIIELVSCLAVILWKRGGTCEKALLNQRSGSGGFDQVT